MNTQKLRAVVRNVVAPTAGVVAVVRDRGHRTVGVGVTRVVRAWKRTLAFVQRRVSAVDIWLQDHHVGVTFGALTLLLAAVGLLLKYRMEEVIDYAKQFAPVFTILSITIGAVLGTLKWFRKRRTARLAARSTTTATSEAQFLGVAIPGPRAVISQNHGERRSTNIC
ncbi:hypothetical protein ACIPJG_33335 [Streptomyces halstedii]|uniref:hypothetical protein n=1 Tax=Streptomyces halstedii TaxID=1944 RepID=UPI00382850FF